MAPPPRIPGRPGSPKPGVPQTVDEAIASKRANELLADDCGEAEEELEALKARYEQYFLGIERREPTRERGEMKRKVERLKDSFTKNTGLRFRLQTLHARYLAYERLWLRSAREKEAGTYRRDLFKARLHRRGEPTPATGTPLLGPAVGPGAPPPAAQAEGARPATPTSAGSPTFSGTDEKQLRALYDAYLDAKRRCQEDVSRLSYDALAKSIHRQVPELMSRFKARSVDFRVEVKDGKAVLKAIPRV
ncbi:MAG TPA: MXAN_5187 C-terminal domain-containing protein [Anaeromyxobacter sp.]|nr:MXAN_5187 C-terminal domain-containing protein [Anaeromyxobacter sp.]